MTEFTNPFRPGAGHQPPWLAGRVAERKEFVRLLGQDTILENMVLTGLRGVGKTVLLDSFKPNAIQRGWLWVGTDLSESASIREINIATRICTDLSIVTSDLVIKTEEMRSVGFAGQMELIEYKLNFKTLTRIYDETPGLSLDKLKAVLEIAWKAIQFSGGYRGIIFAYDEAQNLSDQASKDEYPLSLLLDSFQSIQKKGYPMMLILTGLPTLFPKLVEARTYTERMFRIVFLKSLSYEECKDAILKPIDDTNCPIRLREKAVNTIIKMSGKYPYFIQFICREVYDVFIQKIDKGEEAAVPVDEIERKLDTDFFAGRWARATDRQRQLLHVIALLPNSEDEFTVQEITNMSSKELDKAFSNSHANQMLSTLSDHGLIFKNRHGKYSFAVPLMGRFIRRQTSLQ